MKRFELWLTTVIMFSLPGLVFAQATGGSPGKQVKVIKSTAAGAGRKGRGPAVPLVFGSPKVEPPIDSSSNGTGVGKVAGTGKKPRKVAPTQVPRKKPPRPRAAKERRK